MHAQQMAESVMPKTVMWVPTVLHWWWQVFLTIARKAEVEAAAQEGRSTETIHLANGAVLKVPLGEEYATVEGGTQQYQVKWAQDESGNLQV